MSCNGSGGNGAGCGGFVSGSGNYRGRNTTTPEEARAFRNFSSLIALALMVIGLGSFAVNAVYEATFAPEQSSYQDSVSGQERF